MGLLKKMDLPYPSAQLGRNRSHQGLGDPWHQELLQIVVSDAARMGKTLAELCPWSHNFSMCLGATELSLITEVSELLFIVR